MFVKLVACEFDAALVAPNKAPANATAAILDNLDPIETHFRKLRDGDVIHESVTAREKCNNPAATCVLVSDTGEPRGTFANPGA